MGGAFGGMGAMGGAKKGGNPMSFGGAMGVMNDILNEY